jgi:hypothetical protein
VLLDLLQSIAERESATTTTSPLPHANLACSRFGNDAVPFPTSFRESPVFARPGLSKTGARRGLKLNFRTFCRSHSHGLNATVKRADSGNEAQACTGISLLFLTSGQQIVKVRFLQAKPFRPAREVVGILAAYTWRAIDPDRARFMERRDGRMNPVFAAAL